MASNSSEGSKWTRQQNKRFEKALVQFDQETPDRWENIAGAVGGGKSSEEVKVHYEKLIEDLRLIESGDVPIPPYYSNTSRVHAEANADEEALRYTMSSASFGDYSVRSSARFADYSVRSSTRFGDYSVCSSARFGD